MTVRGGRPRASPALGGVAAGVRVRGINIASFADIWLRGGDASSTYMTLDGSNNATQWTDLSGHGNHATIASGGPNANVAAVRNGHRGLRGNGSSARLNFAGFVMGATNTFAIVTSRASGLMCSLSWTTQSEFICQFGGNSFSWINGANIQTLAASASGVHLLTVEQIDGTSLIGWFDGTQVFSVTPTVALSGKTIKTLFCRESGDLFSDCDTFDVVHSSQSGVAAQINTAEKAFYAL